MAYWHNSPFVVGVCCAYTPRVNKLTRQEQIVLCSVLGLLLVGLAVKTYRMKNPRSPDPALAVLAVTNAAHKLE